MKLGEFLHETEALTYINALKVTLIEIKDELSSQDELTGYLTESRERTRKLMRKADNQYRVIAKLSQREAPVANDVTVEDGIKAFDEMQELMEEV